MKIMWRKLSSRGGALMYNKFVKHLNLKAKVLPASLKNEAGIIGAALAFQFLKSD